jgi:glycosyltransferase involved in cell wall biosynthesis
MYILSICIPTFNRYEFLKRTIDFLHKNLGLEHNIEIVISDNASSDKTENYCLELTNKFHFIKYSRNPKNVGLDLNALNAIKNANSDYCWLLSDDDIPLDGTIERIIKEIKGRNPNLIYLNYIGVLESNLSNIDIEGNKKDDEIYTNNPESMLVKHLISHFSATIINKRLFLKYESLLIDYQNMGFERGYILCLVDHMILTESGTSIFLGEVSLLTRNPQSLIGNNYNPLTIIIDVASHYNFLYRRKLISKLTKSRVVNRYLRGFYNIIIPMRLNYNEYYKNELVIKIHKTCYNYKFYYIYNLPFMLLPNILLKYSYLFYKNFFKSNRNI